MIEFWSTVVPTEQTQQRMPLLWQWAENYTNVFSFKEYEISHIDPSTSRFVLQENMFFKEDTILHSVLKIISYATLIFPVLGYVIRSICRMNYQCVEYSYGKEISKISKAKEAGESLILHLGKKDGEVPTETGFVGVTLHEEMVYEPKKDRIHLKINKLRQKNFSANFNEVPKVFDKVLINGDIFKSLFDVCAEDPLKNAFNQVIGYLKEDVAVAEIQIVELTINVETSWLVERTTVKPEHMVIEIPYGQADETDSSIASLKATLWGEIKKVFEEKFRDVECNIPLNNDVSAPRTWTLKGLIINDDESF